MILKAIKARKILDSRGIATVEVEVRVKSDKDVFTAASPSGTSSGRYEAVSIDVKKALYNVREVIAPKLLSQEFSSQKEVDEILIGLAGPNKENMGVNAVLPVSIACCRALAKENSLPLYSYIAKISNNSAIKLPVPCSLLIEGAKHAENDLNVQEFMAVPNGKLFSENYKIVSDVYDDLKERLKNKFGEEGVTIGMEGGFSSKIETTKQALDLIFDIVKNNNCDIGIDVAASEFYKNDKYNFEGKELSNDELLLFYKKLIKYPIIFIEDPFAEDDSEGWKKTKELRDRGVLIVGDDLTVTNKKRMATALSQDLCNAVILKPNQIGTVTETIEASQAAKEYGWKRIVSHRSGDTTDDFIADLAVGIGAEFIKSGGPYAKERKAKYDRLLAIEKEI